MSQKVITFHYTLTDSDGVEIESSVNRDPVTFMTSVGMIVPGLEKEIVNFAQGDKRRVEVKAEEAYGLIDFNKFVQVPREQLPKQDIKVGDIFQSNAAPTPFTVKQVNESHVVLDGNHPLAGEDLTFDVEVVETRDATEEEIAQLQEQISRMQQGLPPDDAPEPEQQA
jgi:FKBP-type peptidyl-prolyl cis-trans isomerase SlyD